MPKERSNRTLWNRYAKLYDFEVLRFSGAAYEEIYRRITARLTPAMDVLELATGTGLIALHIAASARSVIATDFSPKMIETAQKKAVPGNVRFAVEDATALSFTDRTFDAVVISNALHIMPDPAAALREIRRVLKPGGLLFAPNFTHGHLQGGAWNLSAALLKLIGFQAYAKWTPPEYVDFIAEHGFAVEDWRVLKAAFPLVYLEASLR